MIMKKLFYLFVMAIAMFVMISCSGGGPGDALKDYFVAMQKGEYEKFAEGIDLSNTESDQQQAVREGYASLLKEKFAKDLEKKGGIKSVEILSEDIASDGKTAVVKFKVVYGNGVEQSDEQKMVKTDGKWLMDVGK